MYNFNRPNDRLSVIASAIYRLAKNHAEQWDHIDDFGSGHECGGLVKRTQEEEAVELFDSFGLSPKQIQDALRARTTEKWTFNFAGEVFEMASEEYERREELAAIRLRQIQPPVITPEIPGKMRLFTYHTMNRGKEVED